MSIPPGFVGRVGQKETLARAISAEALLGLVAEAARRLGFGEDDARLVATIIVDADLHGVHSHGVRLFVSHIPQIRSGAIAADARPVLAIDRTVTGVVDGICGYGPVVCDFATTLAMERARTHGIAAFAVRRSSHWGCPSYYARKVAAAGLVLFGASNTGIAMPLWGSSEKSVGNNPVIFGIPTRDGDPWILDISMQQAAWGKLALYRDSGHQLPGTWGLDSRRRPTTDPAAIIASGLINPIGDHKGSGLAVIVEALTGGLAASLHSHEIRERLDKSETQHKSQFFLTMSPDFFGGRDGLDRMTRSFAAAAVAAKRVREQEPVRLPGSGAASRRRTYLKTGIPLSPTLRQAISALEKVAGKAGPD